MFKNWFQNEEREFAQRVEASCQVTVDPPIGYEALMKIVVGLNKIDQKFWPEIEARVGRGEEPNLDEFRRG